MVETIALAALLLLVVLLVDRFIPIPLHYHPLSFYAAFCRVLGRKVNPDPNREPTQLRLSGFLALLLALGLPQLFLLGLYLMSSWPLLIDAMVLLCCLNWQGYQLQLQKVCNSLDKSLVGLSRSQARLLLLRDTKSLTPMGLVKALLESACLRFSQQVIGVVFWYAILGAPAVLLYRFSLIAAQQWPTKLPQFRYFGLPAAWLQHCFCTIPYLLSYLFLLLQQRGKHNATVSSSIAPMSRTKKALIKQLSNTLHVSLGGPVQYQQNKIRYNRFLQENEPNHADLQRLIQLLQHQYHLLLLILACTAGTAMLFI